MTRLNLVTSSAAVAAVVALVVGSIFWPGLDARDADNPDVAVWALQSGEGQRYARVNTELGELDTVRQVRNPSRIAQGGDAAYVLADGMGRVATLNPASPVDLDAEALDEVAATPPGTVEVAQAGDYVAFRTDAGTVSYGRLGGLNALNQLRDPVSTGLDIKLFAADAVAIDAAGVVTAYDSQTHRVLRYDIAADRQLSVDQLPDGPGASGVQVTAVGGRWAVLSGDGKRLWLAELNTPVGLSTTGTVVLQRPAVEGDTIVVADSQGLFSINFQGEAGRRFQATATLGVPAVPALVDGELMAAWLPREGGGTLWRDGQTAPLDYAEQRLSEDAVPQFQISQDRAILNETRSGWVWTLPEGTLVPSSQDWSLAEPEQHQSSEDGSRTEEVLDPKPPVAEPDRFGVRAGELVSLPVLLNDHDANTDVLTIDPRLAEIDKSFGKLTLTDNNQRLAIRVADDATGSVTFNYRVSDGTAANGRYSANASVTLTINSDSSNEAPVWCPNGCLADWPAPEVTPGGTVTVPVLNGWVDPDGDQLLVLGAKTTSRAVSVAATPEGEVVLQHHDSSVKEVTKVGVDVTVADARGQSVTKQLTFRVTPRPKVTADSFAVRVESGETRSIAVGAHVTGTTAKLELTDVRLHGDGKAAVTNGSLAFSFSAKGTGTHLVDYTVSDGAAKATAQVRVTVTDGKSAQLATAPVIAFVRPNEDATIDVLAPVDNPTGRVLLLNAVTAEPTKDSTLTVDTVGQSSIRVLGSTKDGSPGRLGKVSYTVSDGENAAVQGEATVYLLPPAAQLAPIALDDAVTVRAGAQLDIPVMTNDIAPAGSSIALDPRSVRSTEPTALAFASGDLVRTLAPATPGVYQITYSVYVSGSPKLAADGTIRVTVLPDTENRAPRPRTLTGRVLSGQSVEVPFDDLGIDPDGDSVSLDRVVSQPKRGSAAISADGRSITYTSVAGDSGGQVEFRYRVVDSQGAPEEGLVRIGVLDEEASPAPITYTDYVQVQVGSKNSVRVSAAANDIDPTGGTLSISGVRPNVPEQLEGVDNPEYARLEALVGDVTEADVMISAGDAVGTVSYRYDVKSSSGNTGSGLIVVKVVRDEVPNFPVVTDTVLTAETRDQFPTGVDVVTDKASWPGGDTSVLAMTLWEGAGPVAATARDWSISGDLPERSQIVPFVLTAKAADGQPLTTAEGTVIATYGFLEVPGEADVKLTLRSGIQPQVVEEEASVRFDLAGMVAVPSGATLQLGTDGLAASGSRAEASCKLVSGTTVEYRAGAGAPWADSCYVPVKLATQDSYTMLSVPISVTPGAPQPILEPASLTVSPGEDATYDLTEMTTWAGDADPASVVYQTSISNQRTFQVTQQGQQLSIHGIEQAVPGTDVPVSVRITSHEGVKPATLTLRVGPAPSELPQGGTAEQQCSQERGNSCEVTVIGVAGEVNPLPAEALQLTSVSGGDDCPGVSYSVASPRSVRVTWTDRTPGGTCTAAFSVRDAQERTTAGDRNGRLIVDLLGFPDAPDAVSQIGFSDQSVELRVKPGAARNAYPDLKGFYVRRDGEKVATCDASGSCGSIQASLGVARNYVVTAFNSVGESKDSVRTEAWAYDSPPPPSNATATPLVTSGDGKLVKLTINGINSSQTDRLRIVSESGAEQTVRVSRVSDTLEVDRFNVGSNSRTRITITPYSRFNVPPDLGGEVEGQSLTIYGNGIGRPSDLGLTLKSDLEAGGATATITATGTAGLNGDGSELQYGVVRSGGVCQPSSTASTQQLTGLRAGDAYDITMCVASVYQGQVFGTTTATQSIRALQDPPVPSGYTFVVQQNPAGSATNPQWLVGDLPRSAEQPPYKNEAQFETPSSFGQSFADSYRVRYCHTLWQDSCGDWGAVTANTNSAAGSTAPYPVEATDLGIARCVGGEVPAASGSVTGGQGTISVDATGAQYWVPNPGHGGGWESGVGDNAAAPDAADRVRNVKVTVSWPASWGLSDFSTTFDVSCQPIATIEPSPTASETPTESASPTAEPSPTETTPTETASADPSPTST